MFGAPGEGVGGKINMLEPWGFIKITYECMNCICTPTRPEGTNATADDDCASIFSRRGPKGRATGTPMSRPEGNHLTLANLFAAAPGGARDEPTQGSVTSTLSPGDGYCNPNTAAQMGAGR